MYIVVVVGTNSSSSSSSSILAAKFDLSLLEFSLLQFVPEMSL